MYQFLKYQLSKYIGTHQECYLSVKLSSGIKLPIRLDVPNLPPVNHL